MAWKANHKTHLLLAWKANHKTHLVLQMLLISIHCLCKVYIKRWYLEKQADGELNTLQLWFQGQSQLCNDFNFEL
jgi:hypothetical protein